MIIPVRCFTCNKPICNLYPIYLKLLSENSKEEAMNKIGLKRFCCRRMILSHEEIIDKLLMYE
jgi:DNA-directed RNA polymerase I, II, and III subunit RPABC5